MLTHISKALLVGLPLMIFTYESLAATPSMLRKNELLSSDDHLFPITYDIKKKVKFWEKVFLKYSSENVLIHDGTKIIDIIDFDLLKSKKKIKNKISRMSKNKTIQAYLQRYLLGLKRFKKIRKKALRFGAIEKRIYTVYGNSAAGLNSLYTGKAKIRTQTGLSDEFLIAAKRAQKYLSHMESTFINYGIPVRITRLAFVESMFNTKAKSKVGASGIWQFMPNTAKQYLTINKITDERNSPLKATIAAAKLLRDNYSQLKSWPLAITAYNHGRSGIARAVNKLKTRNIATIIREYKSPSFGFASKNFYAEFIAAFNVYNYLLKHKKIYPYQAENLISVTLKKSISIYELLKKSSISRQTLRKHNLGLKDVAFTKYKHKKLPKYFKIFLPEIYSKLFTSKFNSIFRKKYIASIKFNQQ